MIGLASLIVLSTPAHASDADARARELYLAGEALYQKGDYEQAILAWEQSYALSGRNELLFNIANAQERLGLHQETIDTLRRYRIMAPLDEYEAIDARISTLQERVVVEEPVVEEPALELPDEGPNWARVGAFGLLGVGVAGGAVAALGNRSVQSARDTLDQICIEGLCPSEAEEAIAQEKRGALMFDVGTVVGVAALAGGTVLFIRSGKDLSVTAGPTSVGIQVRF